MNTLEQLGTIPVDFAALSTIFSNYRFQKDKIANLVKNGDLIRLKKGLFVVSPKIHRQPVCRELIANHLYGPSYVSFESALSFYSLIPERVHAIRSMTIKRARRFVTPLGNFEYTTSPIGYFEIGIHQESIDGKYAYLIASPEKAICDLIVATLRLRLQSVKAMRIYLEEDLRIELSVLENFDIEIIRQCIVYGKKKTELTHLYKLLNR
jgi:predicted transcriptional regulator of viral defense system